MLRQYKFRYYNIRLVIMVIALTVIGVLAVGSADITLQDKQLMGMGVGITLMFILSFIDYSYFSYIYWIIYIVNILLLLAVLFWGKEVNGATRWLNIAGIQFQPSETAKILLILFFGQFIMRYRNKMKSVQMVVGCIFLLLFPVSLIYKEPDLSTSIMITIIFCILMFVGGLSYKVVIGVLAVIVPSIITFFVLIFRPDQEILEDYQLIRILSWLQPDKYVDAAYQSTNAKIAIGSGMLWGKGLNNNVIASVKNGNFIAEPQTDFIFAVIGEELGFVGGCSVIILLLLIAIECLLIAKNAKDLSGYIIATGMAALIAFQGFINIAVATGIFPNTGIPLPFVSSGLTSLVSLYIGIGIVLNIGIQTKK